MQTPSRPLRTCDSPRRWHRALGAKTSRWTLVTLLLLTGAALAPGVADAGSITYTWHEDDGQNVTGQLIVSDLALFAGQITQPDVIAFAFDTPFESFTQAVLFVPTIPIDMTTGAPTAPHSGLVGQSLTTLELDLDSNYEQISGEGWVEFSAHPPYVSEALATGPSLCRRFPSLHPPR
jgi:hypothetical protein